MAKNNTAFVVTGVIVAVVVGVLAWIFLKGGDVETELELKVVGGVCTIPTKHDVKVGRNHKVTWNVSSSCPSSVVKLGNFRTSAGSTKTDCTDATEGTAVWPFNDNDQNKRDATVPPNKKIELHDAKNDGTTPLTYYFDVCIGSTKVEPQLIIDP